MSYLSIGYEEGVTAGPIRARGFLTVEQTTVQYKNAGTAEPSLDRLRNVEWSQIQRTTCVDLNDTQYIMM